MAKRVHSVEEVIEFETKRQATMDCFMDEADAQEWLDNFKVAITNFWNGNEVADMVIFDLDECEDEEYGLVMCGGFEGYLTLYMSCRCNDMVFIAS